jgi:hypothetical protein
MSFNLDVWILLVGLGIFLFGMLLIEESVRAFRRIIRMFTDGRVRSIGSGALVTARFTAKAKNCQVIAIEWEDPRGVPIDAFLFGSRYPSTVPPVHKAFDCNQGVFMGSIIGS